MSNDETPVSVLQWREVRRAHEAYLSAAQRMGARQRQLLEQRRKAAANGEPTDWIDGWLAAMHEYNEAIVQERFGMEVSR